MHLLCVIDNEVGVNICSSSFLTQFSYDEESIDPHQKITIKVGLVE